jgi:hypothetical protein
MVRDKKLIYNNKYRDNDCSSCAYEGCNTHKSKSITNSTQIYEAPNCKAPLCKNKKEEIFKCDPKFYLTWFGTDKNKKQLKSSNLAMSRFRAYSIGSLYSSARDVFNNTLTDIVKTYEDVAQKTQDIIDKIGTI